MIRKFVLASASVMALGAYAVSASAQDEEVEETEDVIVIQGIKQAIQEAIAIKRESVQIVDSVVAEDIGKLPDNNVIEALQRISGIQITNRGSGESSALFIRGLPDVTTTWNGRNVFTASGRSLALQDIPSNLVSRIDVYKTRAAEQIETGIAGQIDVMSRRPLDLDGFELSLSARGIYQEQSEEFDPNVSALISNKWDTDMGEFGALLNLSYSETNFRTQSITAGALIPFVSAENPPPGFVPLERIFNTDGRVAENPIWQAGLDRGLPTAAGSTLSFNGVDYPYVLARDALFQADGLGERERPAVVAAAQWSPNENAVYTAEFFYQGYRENFFNNLHFTFADWWGSLGADPASTVTYYPGTNLIKTRTVGAPFGFNSGDITESQTDSFVYALNGQWNIGDRFDLEADVSFQESEFETQFLAVRTERVPASLTLDFNEDDGLPAWEFNDNSELNDPSSWTVAQFYENAGRAEGDAVTVSADGTYDLDGWNGQTFFQELKFGFRYDDRGATEFAPPPGPTPFLGVNMDTLPEDFQWYNEGFFDGRANTPESWVVANGYYLQNNTDEVRGWYGVNPLSLEQSFDIQELTQAAYIQLDAESMMFGRPLQTQFGLRYVKVETDMEFTDLANGTPYTRSTDSAEVDDLLPSFTALYDVRDDLRLRFNYGQTLRRPNFVDLNPNFGLTTDLTGVGYGSGSGGNPDLEPVQATNYDFGVEWYFAPDSLFYTTFFRREIEGLVVPLTRQITLPNTGLEDSNGDPVTSFVVTQPVNASDGVLEGFEIGLTYFPDFLPEALDGLGVLGSITNLDSRQNIPQTNSVGEIIGQEETAFFGVSDWSYNVTLAYENGPIGGRLSYVWRENFLNNNEARIFANPIGIWRRPESSLDLQLNYDISDRASISFDAVNLTDELEQSYYDYNGAGGPETMNFGNVLIGRSFAVGLRFNY
ncbi:TonB-dependent receptor [Parvularcula flava]|uniref:TonB-dependent receptor n=1 Tax=Aquisalinus luteolus TaxID=1566827 RepID=A0A8J3A1V9_9PROT|nr:TonB-dependent receptor [Aquisalinus luteolus]NHK27910.1 TonB-dependent receptor [Aquisalinus luteolus]GGH96879.1 TonB-dependent receptor [Aquisalinus luteolus]